MPVDMTKAVAKLESRELFQGVYTVCSHVCENEFNNKSQSGKSLEKRWARSRQLINKFSVAVAFEVMRKRMLEV